MNTSSASISLEVQALQKAKLASVDICGHTNVLLLEDQKLLFESIIKSITVKENKLTFEEIKLLISLYPETMVERNILINTIDKVLLSSAADPYLIAELIAENNINSFGFSLIEKLVEDNKFLDKNHTFNKYFIENNLIDPEVLNQRVVEDWQAKLLLSSIKIFDTQGEPKDLPYIKIYSFLNRSQHYSILTNMHYNTHEFVKFYTIKHLTQNLTGENGLALTRRKILTLHPELYYDALLQEATLKEITIPENIVRGEELFQLLAQTKPNKIKNLFVDRILDKQEINATSYSIPPAFNSILITTNQKLIATPTPKYPTKTGIKNNFSQGFIEHPQRSTVFVKDSDNPLINPENIKITSSLNNSLALTEDMTFLTEMVSTTDELNILIGNPISIHFNPVKIKLENMNAVKVFVDNKGEATHIHIVGFKND